MLTRARIKNFKAIEDITLNLTQFNVLVGANGSGKSSVIQALHWVLQTGRHPKAKAQKKGGSVIQGTEAFYLPSAEYRHAGKGQSYGNHEASSQLEVTLDHILENEESTQKTKIVIRSARNDGISISLPTGNLAKSIKDQDREISSYIPGLAGIPLYEERQAIISVNRKASRGDGNSVLRNILLNLKNSNDGYANFDTLKRILSSIIGPIDLKVNYDETKSPYIDAQFQTKEMQNGNEPWKSISFLGLGYLQVIQIFSYLLLYKPRIAFIDEPDAHLHSTSQERLVECLERVSRRLNTQIIVATHSPSIVRALPAEASLVWMKNGSCEDESNDTIRNAMGWGILDKKIILVTEDDDRRMLRALLSQWPNLERAIAIWPMYGQTKIPKTDVLEALRLLMGPQQKILVHSDKDALSDAEADKLCKIYSNQNIKFWHTKYWDLEAYWCNPMIGAIAFEINESDATEVLFDVIDSFEKSKKIEKELKKCRLDALNKLAQVKGMEDVGLTGVAELMEERNMDGAQYKFKGKSFLKEYSTKLSQKSESTRNNMAGFVCDECELAPDLRLAIEDLLGK